MSGGLVPEIFSHTADLQAYLVGETPARIFARAATTVKPPYWDRLTVVCDYPSGAMGIGELCTCAVGAGQDYPFELAGDEGRLAGDVVKGELTLWPKGGEPRSIAPVRADDPIHGFPGSREMLQEFTDCILGRRDAPRAGIAEALATFEICDAIEASIASGQVVRCAR